LAKFIPVIAVILISCQLFSGITSQDGFRTPSSQSSEPFVTQSASAQEALKSIPPLPNPLRPLNLPPNGKLYHGIYPGGITGEEDDLTLEDLRSYERAAGKSAAWVYFSHNWFHGRKFPVETASWIHQAGSIPYIRLMLRSDAEGDQADPVYSLSSILEGNFDEDLHAWTRAARDFGTPLLVEFGTEVNGEWFPWSGKWNGAGVSDDYGDPAQADGPERFRDAYIHIIRIARQEGATNITWVFHVNYDDVPEEEWNQLEAYYPGSDWIDWLAVSVYGAQTPMDEEWQEFIPLMDAVYPRLASLDENKPMILAEFGVTSGNPKGDQADWARTALTGILDVRWPRLIGFSWWNEYWQNDDNPFHDTHMRLQDNPQLAQVFRELVGSNPQVLGRITVTEDVPFYLPLVTMDEKSIWKPEIRTNWQWQLSGLPVDQSFNVQVYDIDLFENDASIVEAFHAQGRKVICYVSVGSWEDWRPDKDQFPAEVIGKDYEGWEGEKWLDIRRIDLLAPVLRDRFDLCQEKGFDGLEPDNIDGYTSETGFPLSAEDQLAYNIWIASEAHARGLSIGLKNDGDQVIDLLPYFDWALLEDCIADDWCEQFTPFVSAGKAVFAAEYSDNFERLDQFCPQLNALNYNGIFKNRELDAWVQKCH